MNLCLGTAQFGSDYGVQGNGRPDFHQVCDILDTAICNGIRYLDTASAYGDAEAVLGRYFRSHPVEVERIRVVSKLNPSVFRADNSERWAEIALHEAGNSLSALGVRRFHAYLFHNASSIFDSDAVAALYEVERNGLTERIGVSVYTPDEAMQALSYPEIRAIQVPYNVFDQRLDKAGFFERAERQGVEVFTRSSLLQGLAVMNPETLPEHMRFAAEYLKTYRRICERYGIPPLKVAVRYVGNRESVDFVVFGVDNLPQLEEYVSIRDDALPPEMTRELRDAFRETNERLVNPSLWKQ